MKISFIDHFVLIIKDLKKSEGFYSAFLGEPNHKDEYSVSYQIGDAKLFLGLPYGKPTRKFNKEEIGLNHMAFGVRTMAHLKALGKTLKKARIKNSGVQIDKYGKKPFIWFDDPDGIRLEFYLRTK